MRARRRQGQSLSSVRSRAALPPIFENFAPRAVVARLENIVIHLKHSRVCGVNLGITRPAALFVSSSSGAFPGRGGAARTATKKS